MSINSEQNLQIEAALEKVKSGGNFMLGYPVSQDFDYSGLNEFLKYPINNIGDPYESTTNKAQTHKMETEVVDFFAKMFRANPEDYWGYVTNGGSESNLYGLYIARELYPNAMVYFSESTHYSIKKNIRLLNIPSIVIRSQENGEIDYEDLANTLQYNRDKPAIVLTNFGTTMKEAKDDVAKVKEVLRRSAIQDHYIHCDAALSGSYGAFLEPRVPFDFEDGADSISISGHKFIGSPIPSGVIITKRSSKDRIAKGVAYIGSMDTTITGSRNGHSPLFLWYGLHQMGLEGLKARYKHSEEVAAYCQNELNKIGIKAWKNEGAITVVFPKTSENLKEKWQLATDEVAHIICMPNITKKQIDLFVSDALEEQEQKAKA